jgi:hypothetical protein
VGRIEPATRFVPPCCPSDTVTERVTNIARSRPAILAAAALCALAALIAAVWPGDAGSRPLRVIVMGRTADMPAPTDRQATGRVTGFQSLANGTIKPFLSPFDGKVISWSVRLGKVSRPTPRNPDAADDLGFFNDLFGSPPEARIGVLREVPDSHPKEFKLLRQSPIQELKPYFGQTVTFALDHPLTVLEDQVVALTIPTWAPVLYAPRFPPPGNAWRASRLPGKCGETPDQARVELPAGHPQQRTKSKKVYGCYYRGSRLTYTATVVKKPNG